MYTICQEGPKVEYSTVSGMRSRGYERKKLEDAEALFGMMVKILSLMDMKGYFILLLENENEIRRHEIC